MRKIDAFPAMVATRKNPDIKALYERLLAADKTKMCALGAAMRKLVHILLTGRHPIASIIINLENLLVIEDAIYTHKGNL